jgi:purine-binding chemotaxis protein CheW
MSGPSTTASHLQYCTFHLADLFLGVEVTRVREVIRRQPSTPVPLASPVISGLMNLRGEIVTTIDLRRRLGLPDRDADKDPMNVVIGADDGVVSLLVDEIGDVVDAREEAFEPSPATLRSATRDVIVGVYKLDGRLLLILDCDKVLDLGATTLAEAS